ncbi:LPS O-antigen length regulator [Pseudoalteromonas sp. 13-15]|uniref:Wzz/FepE/Etk N-terminal domain-containing protein n=1 Tax=Pseudoalteromonas TaxID=53246 RepID=UPI000731242F|nr:MULTISPECIES: Wzz/FepE/Etk N-terminal domain-containing protein [Pseudoalteromonas]AUL74534.1 LPS O-antigen length regulator [Pseudoalteromonas sp. 13-15]WFO19436.1 Wzz/FepE/Etk N-terminal domain-containing protein [Pseudoalteromonas sp. H100]SIO05052.1 LPS O-antigen chain length determinant protein, WzzB/FepE family [Pseudoalteromonas marina]
MNNNQASIKENNDYVQSHDIADDEINLRELFAVIWKGKWIIIAVTALFALASVFYAIHLPNIYKSEALLAPAEQENSGGLAGLAGQFGGLASLAGVNLGGGSSNKAQLAIEVLKSRQFTSDFIKKHNILPYLMSAKTWNMQTDAIIHDSEIYNAQNNKWVREVSAPFKPKPSMQEAYKEFSKILSASTDKETGMVKISIEHVSPTIAQQWVSWLIQDINQTMKQRDVLEAIKSTDFLTQQLEQTKIADIRAVLYKLVEEQTKTIMFAKVRDEYVFKTIDAALVPEEKFKPKRALICVLGLLLGGMLSVMIVLIRHFVGNSKS